MTNRLVVPDNSDMQACADMVNMLAEGEWAEHAGCGPVSRALEEQITRLLNELHAKDEEITRLTTGQPVHDPDVHKWSGLPDNLLSHQNSWRAAIERAVELEPVTGRPDEDEKGFWQRELGAFNRTFANLNMMLEMGYVFSLPDGEQHVDTKRLNLLEQLTLASYTGISFQSGPTVNDVKLGRTMRMMWQHHLGEHIMGGKTIRGIRAAIDASADAARTYIEKGSQ